MWNLEKYLKKILLLKHLEPIVIFALLKGGGLCPAAAEHPLLCVQKNQEYHHFLM